MLFPPFTFPPAVHLGLRFSRSSPTLVIYVFFIVATLLGGRWCLVLNAVP